MHCEHGEFPGLNVDGGFAQYLRTVERSTLKLEEGLAPSDARGPSRGSPDRLPIGR